MYKMAVLGLFPLLAFAGAGANGGSGSSTITGPTYNMLYGVFSVNGSIFDYVSTDAPPLTVDTGNDILTDAATGAGVGTLLAPEIAALVANPSDDIAFSTGALGDIADPTDASEIVAEAVLLDLIPNSSVTSSSTSIGSYQSTVTDTSDSGCPSACVVETTVTTYTVDVENVNFSGASAVPEPATFSIALAGLGIVVYRRKVHLR